MHFTFENNVTAPSLTCLGWYFYRLTRECMRFQRNIKLRLGSIPCYAVNQCLSFYWAHLSPSREQHLRFVNNYFNVLRLRFLIGRFILIPNVLSIQCAYCARDLIS